MKLQLEQINPDRDSSFHILITPHLADVFLWHYHPEYEIVYIEGANGTRHVGEHISRYEDSDLVFIGPNIPHLNFDYGVRTEHHKVVVQLQQDFLGETFWRAPECGAIAELFERARAGVSFHGQTKERVGGQLKGLVDLPPLGRLLRLLGIFQDLATTPEWTSLHGEAVSNAYNLTEQQRLKRINQFIAEEYPRHIEIAEVAALSHLTNAAFCRYFKRMTHLTFTQYLNRYRVNQAQKMLLLDHTVSEAGFACGFESLSYFNKTFRRVTGENPLQFKKRHRV